jgi:hypothetical protein
MGGRKPTCCRCGKLKERIRRAYCRACENLYQRQLRKRHPLLRQRPCRHCGESRTERHHPDYARPLYVIWLCRPCHLKLHANKRRRARHHVKQARKGGRR